MSRFTCPCVDCIVHKCSLQRLCFVQVNITVTELKSEALKDRHWKDLMKKLRVRWVMTDLTLGQIWDVDLQRNEAIVKDVILMAQGEMGLEVFLRQVRLLTRIGHDFALLHT